MYKISDFTKVSLIKLTEMTGDTVEVKREDMGRMKEMFTGAKILDITCDFRQETNEKVDARLIKQITILLTTMDGSLVMVWLRTSYAYWNAVTTLKNNWRDDCIVCEYVVVPEDIRTELRKV